MPEAIRLDKVSKKYIIQHAKKRSFQEVFVSRLAKNGAKNSFDASHEEFWALRDVSFSIRRGETVGLIGQNGSGKSTTLKLVTRIIEPTSGKVTVNGSISSLLELGAGMHPDLSGRENVFLNGSLLGLSRRLMESKFDEIVEFSELEQFIDVPVKHYSSGMYMRLAFAVAINVDPDILLIDEVLAVGDQAFQSKCLEKIRDFQSTGKTIVFVTHGLETVKLICNRAIWLDHGTIRSMGDSKRVIFDYLSEVQAHQQSEERREPPASRGEAQESRIDSPAAPTHIRITDVNILGRERTEKRVFSTRDDLIVRLLFALPDRQLLQDFEFSVSVVDANGTLVHKAILPFEASKIRAEVRRGFVELKYANVPLLEGVYNLSVAVWPTDSSDAPIDVYHKQKGFSIETRKTQGHTPEDGLVSLQHRWIDCCGIGNASITTMGKTLGLIDYVAEVQENGSPDNSYQPLPSYICMGENDAGCLGSGWYDAEGENPRFRWTAERAILHMTVPKGETSVFFKVCDPNANLRPLTGRVLANGICIGEFAKLGPEIQSLSFALAPHIHGRVGLEIEVKPTLTPAERGMSDDIRNLGLVVYEVWAN